MLFSSISFLYYFLPAVLILYFIVPKNRKNTILLIASLFFYFYGEPKYVVLMILSSVSGYLHGLWIEKAKVSGNSKLPLASSIVIGFSGLLFFKYTDFFIQNTNWMFNTNIPLLRLALPIGISFYTFQILSYTIDVYRGEAKVQKNLFDFMTYVTLFPQLIAGPIVRYTTVEAELAERSHSFKLFAEGVNRFVIGLSKKVILANTLGELGKIFADSGQKTVLFYWIMSISFMLQVYFDFSGYSDMAIGLGKIFGFQFLENFNYPFIAKSVSEFWRRWHMSLGTWFRDYVYIPMGGNRGSTWKWLRNVAVVWFLTGFWHGAQWNFIIWGLYFACFLVLEKFWLNDFFKKLPSLFRRMYMFFVLTISFVIFNADRLGDGIQNLKGMFGLLKVPFTGPETMYYLRSYGLMLIIAFIGATPLAAKGVAWIKERKHGKSVMNFVEPVFHGLMLLLITGYLVDGSF
ncbi:MAG TPA: transcriptional regulator, partial [Clostridiales bacterium]|nr:transcriptional regulator [Clostridiales bacterium]